MGSWNVDIDCYIFNEQEKNKPLEKDAAIVKLKK